MENEVFISQRLDKTEWNRRCIECVYAEECVAVSQPEIEVVNNQVPGRGLENQNLFLQKPRRKCKALNI